MTEFRKATIPVGARTLPGAAYSSEAVFADEQVRIFGRRWICAGRAAAMPGPGDFLTCGLGDESILIVRGEDGALRGFHNFCRHRGSRLCTEEQGHLPGGVRCPYHGWCYGLDGQLTGAPRMRETPGFQAEEYPLLPVGVAEWEGFLFLNLAAEHPPFEEEFAPLMGRFAAWRMACLRPAHRLEYQVQANWKLLVENYSECYHCALVHPALVQLSPPDSGRNDLLEGPFLGGYMTLRDGAESMTGTGRSARPRLGTLAGEELRRVYYYSVFPNLLLSLHPDYVMAHTLFPGAARQTRVVCEWYFDPAVMREPYFDPWDAVEFWDHTNRQDWHACELAQLGVASRSYTPGPYAESEGLLWEFGREYRKWMELV